MILITGGAGFFGSNLVKTLLREGYEVRVIDDLSYGSLLNLQDVRHKSGFHFIRGSILNREMVKKSMDGVNIVINMAALTHVDRSILSSLQFARVDFEGTGVMLEASLKSNVNLFIQVSTSEVYGTRITKKPMDESHPLIPHSPYAASKCGADRLAKSYHITYGLPVIILRFFNLYGPFQYPEKFIPLSITNLLLGEKVPLYGDGKQKRDWVYVDDGVKAILKALKYGEKYTGEEINIATGKSYENIFILNRILELTGRDQSFIKHVKDRPGHVTDLKGSYKKAYKTLKWEPSVDIEEGLRRTVEWYIENKNWWRRRRNETKFRKFYKEWYGRL